MALRFDCPSCKANYEVADDLAGKIIMCRVCKQRGKVQSLPAQTPSATAQKAAARSESAMLSRRNFLPIAGLVVASLGAIATGALLARQPWRKPSTDDFGPGRRRKGPPPGEKQMPDDKKGPPA